MLLRRSSSGGLAKLGEIDLKRDIFDARVDVTEGVGVTEDVGIIFCELISSKLGKRLKLSYEFNNELARVVEGRVLSKENLGESLLNILSIEVLGVMLIEPISSDVRWVSIWRLGRSTGVTFLHRGGLMSGDLGSLSSFCGKLNKTADPFGTMVLLLTCCFHAPEFAWLDLTSSEIS